MLKEQILEIINQAASELGYDVYEAFLYLKGEKTRIIVRIDNKTPGSLISHSDCERYSSKLASLLDAKDLLPNYFLEISSPGINRKVRDKEEFIRFTGSPVKIIYEDLDKRISVKGVIVAADDENVEISSNNNKILIKYSDIINANLDY